MFEDHHKHSSHLPLPLSFVLFVDSSDSISHSFLVLANLLELWPIFFGLRYFAVPVTNLGFILNIWVDPSFEDVGEMSRRSEGFVEVTREMDITESWSVTYVEKRNMSKGNRFGEM